MSLARIRSALGSRAVDGQWDARRCRNAVLARLDIAAGVDAAATWSRALFGNNDHAEYIARYGVDGHEAARSRWTRKRVALEQAAAKLEEG